MGISSVYKAISRSMAIPHSKLFLLRALLIIAAGFWVFVPALHGDWLMDDDMYLTQHVLLNDPARLWKIWFVPGSFIEYYPIEETLQYAQWQLWHFDTLGYHLTNVVLHLIGALLVWRLLAKFGLRLAWLGGFLFAVHPVTVESVAWISEFKNTLSLPPFLLAMCAWIDFDARRRPRDYTLALGLFVIAMLCKITMALFPFAMLLYAWWKRGRVGRDGLVLTAPFFSVSLVLGSLTILCGTWLREARLQPSANPHIGDFWAHVGLSGWCIAFYLAKCLWPVKMLFLYPKWTIDTHALYTYLPWPVLIGTFAWLWHRRATWGRHALLGLGFFLILIAPFVGFTSVSYMQMTWVMDHFTYLPLVGLVGLAVAAAEDLQNKASPVTRPVLGIIAAVALALLAWESESYAATFSSPEALWSHTIAGNPSSAMAHNSLGTILVATGRTNEGIAELEQAIQLQPNSVEPYNNLGYALEETGHLDQAIAYYQRSLQQNPHFATGRSNLANALLRAGRLQEALDQYKQVLEVNPNDTHAQEQVAQLKAQLGVP